MSDEAAKEGGKSDHIDVVMPLAPATMKRNIQERINKLWTQEWMANPDWCRQTKYFFKEGSKAKANALMKYGKQSASRFIRFTTGHAFLRKHNAYVKHKKKPGQILPFDEMKCRHCGTVVEEPVHIITECEAFMAERYEEFNCLEWQDDTEWEISQMMRFLEKFRVTNLEEE